MIEQVFVEFKHLMRKAAERTHLCNLAAYRFLLSPLTPDDFRDYLFNSVCRAT